MADCGSRRHSQADVANLEGVIEQLQSDSESYVRSEANHSQVFTALHDEAALYVASHGNEKDRLSTEAAARVDPAKDLEKAATHAPGCVAAIKDFVGLTRFGEPVTGLSEEARLPAPPNQRAGMLS